MQKEIVNQSQDAQRVPGRINPRRNTLRHSVIKLINTKDKDKILKATWEKRQITYKLNSHQAISWFLNRKSTCQRECHDIFKVMKRKNLPRILYPARLSFRFGGEIKSFPDKQKLEEFSFTAKISFTTNAKGTSLGRKHKRRKRPIENKPKTIKR